MDYNFKGFTFLCFASVNVVRQYIVTERYVGKKTFTFDGQAVVTKRDWGHNIKVQLTHVTI